MHGELTAVAVANNDPSLKPGVRRALALLQDARASLTELMQVAATHRVRPAPPSSLTDLWLDLQQDIRQYTESSHARVALTVAGQELAGDCPLSELSVDLDSVRVRKALLYLIQAMQRHCLDRTLHLNAQFVPVAEDQLHMVFTVKALYGPSHHSAADAWIERMSSSALGRVPPAQLRWTDREARVVDYLLRSIGITPTYTVSESGSVSIVIELTCRFTRGSSPSSPTAADEKIHRPVVAGVVTDDPALGRLMARGDLAHIEFRIISLGQALADLSALAVHTVLLIDVSGDISDAFTLIHRLRAQKATLPLIAVCPPGRVSTQLGEKLFDAGFTGIVQKPIQYGRVIEVLEAALGMARHPPPSESQLSR
jgi:hypothetical protein